MNNLEVGYFKDILLKNFFAFFDKSLFQVRKTRVGYETTKNTTLLTETFCDFFRKIISAFMIQGGEANVKVVLNPVSRLFFVL